MKNLFHFIFRKNFYERIPYEDLMSRQRFTLFRIYSYTAFIASIASAIQIQAPFAEVQVISIVLISLATVIMTNFFMVKDVDRLPVAYMISVFVGFLVVHLQAYSAGGLMNSGTIYLTVILMTAFMLLGTKAGKWFTVLAIASVGMLFYATEFTMWTSYAMFQDDIHLIRQDALTTFILGLILVAAQSNYMHSGKNVIIERITLQKDQLAESNRKLQHYTVHLERTNRELDKFASIVSHDLKAPLRAIGNLTGWIEEDAGETLVPEARTHFNMIKQRVKRMEDLINAILDYSRADERTGEDVKVVTKSLIEETLEFIGKPDNVTLEIAEPMPEMISDKTRLQQVFSNLLGNAIKYNDKENIHIKVSVVESDKGWEFSVKDNGPGIEEQYHEKVFIIFQTLNRRDDVESTGVGLAIVKKIIEDQGGKIWVESDGKNGSDFRFIWPKVKKEKDSVLIAAAIIV
ncbi:MAG TPA: ATP-binding protein [Bacteroidia bacterium]|nr:ATP-binding protein [Bacteroidia bacterium]